MPNDTWTWSYKLEWWLTTIFFKLTNLVAEHHIEAENMYDKDETGFVMGYAQSWTGWVAERLKINADKQ